MPTEELLDDPEMDGALRELFVVAPRSRAWERALRKDLMTFIASGAVAQTATSVAGGGHAFDTELRVRSTARLSTRSRGVLLAGAGCLAVLAIGVALNSRRADPVQGPVTTTRPALVVPPLRPDRFPLVPDTDPRASAATAMYGGQIGLQNPPRSEALVARIDGDTMTEAIALSVSAGSYSLPIAATATEMVTVAGTDMELHVEGGTPIIKAVVLPGTPTFVAVGLDPVAFLEAIGGFPIADVQVDADGEVSFTLSALPDGYQLVVPPTRLPRGSFDALTNVPDGDAGDGMSVWVEVHNPLLSAATAGDLRRVDINGISGWTRDDGPGSPVVWQVSQTTWASVSGATTPEDALQFARSVTFVDEATWRERYDLEEPVYRTEEEESQPSRSTVPELTGLIGSRRQVEIDTVRATPVDCIGSGASYNEFTAVEPVGVADEEMALGIFLSTPNGQRLLQSGYEETFVQQPGYFRYERRNTFGDLVTVIFVDPVGDGWAVTRWQATAC